MTRTLFRLMAGVAVALAAPATAKPIGFALVDVEGADADQLARLGARGAAEFVAALVARKPASIVANTMLDSQPEAQESRFVTPPPKGVIPKKGVPASVYIVTHHYDGIAIWGELEYRDYTRKTPSPTPPAGVGFKVDRKGFREDLLDDRARMVMYGTLTRDRSHGSRYLVAVFQADGPVKVAELASAEATLGHGRSNK